VELRSVEIFTGAGGLALGIAEAGVNHVALVEWDHYACETIRLNQAMGLPHVRHWPLYEADATTFDFAALPRPVDILAGGPPCQPFSLGGKHRAQHDPRDMFPTAVRAVRELHPRAFIFENVRGLVRPTFANYFAYILRQLEYPEVHGRDGECWMEHLRRLEKHHTASSKSGLRYNVVYRVLNAADYGTPQKRERVFVVGFRSDLDADWAFPPPTHSLDALLWSQWIAGDYWERHEIARRDRPEPSAQHAARVARLEYSLLAPDREPWRTVADAIVDLPDPEDAISGCCPSNHEFVPGARAYPGHTGSPEHEPAKTLKAGDHGVPGGENMLSLTDGRLRYFTVRECARLQQFPDAYVLRGSRTEMMRQLGNAVPVGLARCVAHSVATRLMGEAASCGPADACA